MQKLQFKSFLANEESGSSLRKSVRVVLGADTSTDKKYRDVMKGFDTAVISQAILPKDKVDYQIAASIMEIDPVTGKMQMVNKGGPESDSVFINNMDLFGNKKRKLMARAKGKDLDAALLKGFSIPGLDGQQQPPAGGMVGGAIA